MVLSSPPVICSVTGIFQWTHSATSSVRVRSKSRTGTKISSWGANDLTLYAYGTDHYLCPLSLPRLRHTLVSSLQVPQYAQPADESSMLIPDNHCSLNSLEWPA